jgi:hypothetical protein
VQFRRHDQLREPLTLGEDAGRCEDLTNFGASAVVAADESRRKQCLASLDQSRVDLQFPVAACHAAKDSGSSQLQQPVNVLRQHEVPRWSQDMGAKNVAFVEE